MRRKPFNWAPKGRPSKTWQERLHAEVDRRRALERANAIAAAATCHLCGETRYLTTTEMAALRGPLRCPRPACGGRLLVERESAA